MRKRTKYLLGIGVIAALVIGWQIAAYAVHDTTKFELDGNADNGAAAGDDWANVFAGTTTGSTATSFESETAPANLQKSIFTGGGSKDPQDIGNWKWKDDAGGLPDKDNLLDSFAARYNGTSDGDVLFFGSDRYDNSGDATQGFWFFQNKITQVGTGSGTFSGVHKAGDLLVVTDFSNGGGKSTIEVFKWDPTCLKAAGQNPSAGQCADANLRLLAESGSANCANTNLTQPPPNGTSDQFCGIVNPQEDPLTNAPWPFLDKSGNSDYLNGEFFEGGVSLTALGIANECFSSVASETRSSTSTTAVLKDFVLGQLQQCQAGMTTDASTGTDSVTPGTAVHDTATISVSGGANAPDPTSPPAVTFFLCANATNGCPSPGGTNIGTGNLVGGANTNDGTATATSPDVNTSGSPLTPGRYCFRAEWLGDTNYPTDLSFTNNTDECFTVSQPTSITTTQKWLPQDTATVTPAGTAGTVEFSLYENGTCSGTPARTFQDSSPTNGVFETDNSTYRTATTTISWSATFDPSGNEDPSTTTRCERSELTINNSASDFPPPQTP